MAGESDEGGVCALCGPDVPGTRTLRQSHFLPKAIYRYFNRSKAEGTKLLIRTEEDGKVFSLGTQAVQALLCDECEGLMSAKGEDYCVSQMLKIDSNAKAQSPVYQTLLFSLVPLWRPLNDSLPGTVLSVGSNPLPAIESQQIYHFAIGMFWKATFKGWKHCPVMPMESSVVEQMRKYLRGGEFLPDHVVRIVPSFWQSKFSVAFPTLIRSQPFFSIQSFDFYLEKSEQQFRSAMSMGAVPVLYTVDQTRSEMAYRNVVANFNRAEQTNSSASTKLTWLDE